MKKIYYIETTLNGYVIKKIEICDFKKSLLRIMENRDMTQTPDGLGWFDVNKTLNAYIEVVSLDKLLKDASNRNKILFDKLGL